MSNFQPLEVVGRGSETQLQVAENLNKLIQQDTSQALIVSNRQSRPTKCISQIKLHFLLFLMYQYISHSTILRPKSGLLTE